METKISTEKTFSNKFPIGKKNAEVKAGTRDGKLIFFHCYDDVNDNSIASVTEEISFIIKHWKNIEPVWEAVEKEITGKGAKKSGNKN